MGEIYLQLPARILFGVNETKRLGMVLGKFGRRVLMITSTEEKENAGKIRHLLEEHGIGVILFDEEPVKGSSFVMEDCLKLARVSHVDSILACGNMNSIVMARALACSVSDGLHPDFFMNGEHSGVSSLPVVEVISDFWNPFFLDNAFYITSSRNGCTSFVRYSPHSGNLQCCDPVQALSLPARRRTAQYFDLLLHVVCTALSRKISFLGREHCLAAFKRAWPLRRSMLDPWTLENAGALMEAGFLAAMAQQDSGPSWVCMLVQAISGHFDISRNIIAMIMAPFVLDFLNEHLPGEFNVFIRSLRGLEEAPESPQDFIDTFRELLGWYDMPSQLRSTGIAQDALALASETAGQMLEGPGGGGITVDQMFELMESCW